MGDRNEREERDRDWGAGRVFRRGETWWFAYYYGGREMRESSGSKSEDVARRLLARRIAAKDEGRAVVPVAKKVTLDDMAKMLESSYVTKRNRSWDRARRSVAHLRAYFGGKCKAVTITSGRWTQYVCSRYEEGAKPSTVNLERAALRRMFRLAQQDGKIPVVPHLERIDVDNARTGFFEDDDFRKVVSHLRAPLRPLVTFLFLTGWRKSEALNLRWSAVNLAAGTVRLEGSETKSGEPRVFPFAAVPELSDVLHRQYQQTMALERATGREVPWVFWHRDGEPIRSFYTAWRSACRKAGLEGRVPHDFRRSAALRLRRLGLSETDIMELCGWETRAMFERYCIKDQAGLAARLAKALSDKNSDRAVAAVKTLTRTTS